MQHEEESPILVLRSLKILKKICEKEEKPFKIDFWKWLKLENRDFKSKNKKNKKKWKVKKKKTYLIKNVMKD